MKFRHAWVALVVAFSSPAFAAEDAPFLRVVPRVEVGLASVLEHHYQSGAQGTHFDFVRQGAEDTLFAFQRYSVDVLFNNHHIVTFLYQPLTLQTQTVADRNGTNGGRPVVIDDASFAPGTALDVKYGFDFWRASYLYNFKREPGSILGVGVSLQLRNASLAFTAVNGSARAVEQNIGPVPVLKFRFARWFSARFGLDFEADGFYASSAIFNGSGKPFTGWIWDAALSAKTRLLPQFLPQAVAFLSLRSIGGGARGNNAYAYVSSTTSVNPYSYDNLATLEVCLGASLE